MNKATTKKAPAKIVVEEDYLDLVREFPLRPLKGRNEHLAAQSILDRLIGRDDLAKGEREYLSALVRFVEDYEREQAFSHMQRMPPLDLLKQLLEQNDMNTSDLGAILGSRGLASEVLHGKSGLSKTLVLKLAQRFAVDPILFWDISKIAG